MANVSGKLMGEMTRQMEALSAVRVSWGVAATLAVMFKDNKVHTASVAGIP